MISCKEIPLYNNLEVLWFRTERQFDDSYFAFGSVQNSTIPEKLYHLERDMIYIFLKPNMVFPIQVLSAQILFVCSRKTFSV